MSTTIPVVRKHRSKDCQCSECGRFFSRQGLSNHSRVCASTIDRESWSICSCDLFYTPNGQAVCDPCAVEAAHAARSKVVRGKPTVECPECGKRVTRHGLKNHQLMAHEGDPRAFRGGDRGADHLANEHATIEGNGWTQKPLPLEGAVPVVLLCRMGDTWLDIRGVEWEVKA
jgi:hypothetical protein